MVVAEIAAGVTIIRAMMDITKAMVNLRDAEAFRAKSIELQGLIADALEKAITARESQAEQAERIRTLETEVTKLKAWDAEKHKYELKSAGHGAVAYMLKRETRGSEPPHWLCPTCFADGKKAFLQPTGATIARGFVYKCQGCPLSAMGWRRPMEFNVMARTELASARLMPFRLPHSAGKNSMIARMPASIIAGVSSALACCDSSTICRPYYVKVTIPLKSYPRS